MYQILLPLYSSLNLSYCLERSLVGFVGILGNRAGPRRSSTCSSLIGLLRRSLRAFSAMKELYISFTSF
jgi:hypothetical protein